MATTEIVLPRTDDARQWTEDERAGMQALGLAGMKKLERHGEWVEVPFQAPMSIVRAYSYYAAGRGLDAIAGQVWAAEIKGKWSFGLRFEGWLILAERTGLYEGFTAPEFTGDGKTWVQAWIWAQPPAACRVGVRRKGWPEPVYFTASYQEFAPRDRKGEVQNGPWRTSPANQLSVLCKRHALREAFPAEFGALAALEDAEEPDVKERERMFPPGHAPHQVDGAGGVDEATGEVVDDDDEPAPFDPPMVVAASRDWIGEAEQLAAEHTDDPDEALGALRDLLRAARAAGEGEALVGEDLTVTAALSAIAKRFQAQAPAEPAPEPTP